MSEPQMKCSNIINLNFTEFHKLLVATGRAKAEAVHHMAEGAVTAMWPGSILQHHPHVTVLVDGAAAQRLQLADYYRETYTSKPDWQGV